MDLAGLPPFPNSWYALATSEELGPGVVLNRRLASQDLVIFRTEAGEAIALDAYCPHMGAHLGHGSEIVGNNLRCDFHGFEFDNKGQCVRTGYNTKPPPSCRMKSWPVIEAQGVLFVYHGAKGQAPTWTIPALDMDGWLPLKFKAFELEGHPQEIHENSVDIGHLTWIHKYENVGKTAELTSHEETLKVSYKFTRLEGILGLSKPIHSTFTAEEHGLGFAVVNVVVTSYDLRIRLFIMPTPTDPGKLVLRVGMSIHKDLRGKNIHPALGLLPQKLLQKMVFQGAFKGFLYDIGLDFEIWRNKTYLQHPRLAAGDGPIGVYRRWTKQFYPAQAASDLKPSAPSLAS